LGEPTIDSPLETTLFVENRERQLLDIAYTDNIADHRVAIEKAGPRKRLFFDPAATRVAVCTCGGLCPGLNNVIRALVLCLWHRYGVRSFLGLRFGYEGLNPETAEIMDLEPGVVRHIHKRGGTILGTSRGPQSVEVMTKFLIDKKINILFTIGGDGTLKGAKKICDMALAKGANISVIGIPKTIDNDISFTDKTFGFDTATDIGAKVISGVHNEAISHRGGVGIVKLMGRHSGFIALHASLASGDANLVLLPEVKFTWEALLKYLTTRFMERKKNDVVIVVAEGAGQDLMEAICETDPSGNRRLGDIGLEVKKRVTQHMKELGLPFTVKYVDPSYMIRCAEANSNDCVYSVHLSQMAAHAAMSGRTGIVVSRMHGNFVHVPMEKAIQERKEIDRKGWLYETLLDATGQPQILTPTPEDSSSDLERVCQDGLCIMEQKETENE